MDTPGKTKKTGRAPIRHSGLHVIRKTLTGPKATLLVAPRTSNLMPSICDYFITKLHGELRTLKPSPLADYVRQPSENSRNKGHRLYKEYRTCGLTPAALSAFEDTNHMAKALPLRG